MQYTFPKATHPFDFIILNVIRKLAYKVKCISEINRSLFFFRNLGIRLFIFFGLDCEQYGNNQYKKKDNTHARVMIT